MESLKCFKQCLKNLINYKTQMKSFCPTVLVIHQLWKGESSLSVRLFSTMFYVLFFNTNFLKPNKIFSSVFRF